MQTRLKPFKGRSPRLSGQSMWRSVPYIPSQTAQTLKNLDQTFLYNPPILGNQRTGGLAWIWRQPPKLQAGGSNPLPFATSFYPALKCSSRRMDSPIRNSVPVHFVYQIMSRFPCSSGIIMGFRHLMFKGCWCKPIVSTSSIS